VLEKSEYIARMKRAKGRPQKALPLCFCGLVAKPVAPILLVDMYELW
jgi:hypothetical protein